MCVTFTHYRSSEHVPQGPSPRFNAGMPSHVNLGRDYGSGRHVVQCRRWDDAHSAEVHCLSVMRVTSIMSQFSIQVAPSSYDRSARQRKLFSSMS